MAEIVTENKLINFKALRRPLCKLRAHDYDLSTVYQSGTGCVTEQYLRCRICGKKLPVKPEYDEQTVLDKEEEA